MYKRKIVLNTLENLQATISKENFLKLTIEEVSKLPELDNIGKITIYNVLSQLKKDIVYDYSPISNSSDTKMYNSVIESLLTHIQLLEEKIQHLESCDS